MAEERSVNFVGPDASAILERLKVLHDVKSDRQLAAALQVSASTLAGWRHRNSVPLETLLFQCSTNEASMDYLLFGKGELKRSVIGAVDPEILRIAARESLRGLKIQCDEARIADAIVRYYHVLIGLRDVHIQALGQSDELALAAVRQIFEAHLKAESSR